MTGRRVSRVLAPLALAVALVLSGCSSEPERVAPYPVELPDPPPDASYLDVAGVVTPLTTLTLGFGQASGSWLGAEPMFDVTEEGPDSLIAHYDDELAGQGWERAPSPTELNGKPAALWEGDDQRVMMVVVTLQERDVAVLLTSSERF